MEKIMLWPVTKYAKNYMASKMGSCYKVFYKDKNIKKSRLRKSKIEFNE